MKNAGRPYFIWDYDLTDADVKKVIRGGTALAAFYLAHRDSKDFDTLYSLTKQKDLGLEEFYFANSIANIDRIKIWPTTKIPFDHQAMLKFYRDFTRDLLLRIKPAE